VAIEPRKSEFFYHGEEQTFRQKSQHGIVYVQGLRPARKYERLKFDTRHVLSGFYIVAKSRFVRHQDRGARSHAIHQQLRVEKLEHHLRFRVPIHQVETGFCFCQSDLYTDARGQESRHVTYVAVKPAVQLNLFAFIHTFPRSEEAHVLYGFGRGVEGQEVPIVQIS